MGCACYRARCGPGNQQRLDALLDLVGALARFTVYDGTWTNWWYADRPDYMARIFKRAQSIDIQIIGGLIKHKNICWSCKESSE